MKNTKTLVSVVIPTANRPHLVVRAVRSALAQTLNNIEVIVVIDGPEEMTENAIKKINDHRLRYTVHAINSGCAASRNTGVSLAQSPWIAFLDDDDLWMPEKLELQLRTAEGSMQKYPVIACRVKAQDEKGEYIWPRRYPALNENMSEYLFCCKTPFWGEGLVLPSAMFVSRELLMKVNFRLSMNDDIDWLLRAYAQENISVEFVKNDMPMVVWNIETVRSRISNTTDWEWNLSWIRSVRHLVTDKAYFSFVLTWVGLRASRSRQWRAFPVLVWDAFRKGTPSWNDVVYFLGIWLIPSSARQWLALQYGKLFRKVDRSQENKHA